MDRKSTIRNGDTPWCNGNTAPFGGVIHGSNPCGVGCLANRHSHAGNTAPKAFGVILDSNPSGVARVNPDSLRSMSLDQMENFDLMPQLSSVVPDRLRLGYHEGHSTESQLSRSVAGLIERGDGVGAG